MGEKPQPTILRANKNATLGCTKIKTNMLMYLLGSQLGGGVSAGN